MISRRMSVKIIDLFKAIEIQAHNGDARIPSSSIRNGRCKTFVKSAAVGQIRQAIVMRHVGDTIFRLAPFRDILQQNDEVFCNPHITTDRDTLRRDKLSRTR